MTHKTDKNERLSSAGYGIRSGTLSRLLAGLTDPDPIKSAMARGIRSGWLAQFEQWVNDEEDRGTSPTVIMDAAAFLQIQLWACLMAQHFDPDDFPGVNRHYISLVGKNMVRYAQKMWAASDEEAGSP